MKELNPSTKNSPFPTSSGLSRRQFVQYSSLAGLGLILASCTKEDPLPAPEGEGINLGEGDSGILNYHYVVEQVLAEFFTRVSDNPYSGMTEMETNYFGDIKAHQLAHREIIKSVLGNRAIGLLRLNLDNISYSSRSEVLAMAMKFKEISISAYIGSLHLLTHYEHVGLLSKMASVASRHASFIRETISPGSFLDNSDASGLDKPLTPADVLVALRPYIAEHLQIHQLPTQ